MKLNCIEKYINFVPINTPSIFTNKNKSRMKLFLLLLLFIPLVSGCQKSYGLHEVFLKDQIQCESNVTNCPEEVVVYTIKKKWIHPIIPNYQSFYDYINK